MIRIIIASLVVPAFFMPEPAEASRRGDRDALKNCANAVLESSWSQSKDRRVKFEGHEFNCKRQDIRSNGDGSFTVSGQLSHMLRLRDDDQLYFSFTTDYCTGKARPGSLKVRLNRGGLAPIAGTIGRFFGERDFERSWRRAAQDWDGKWEGAAATLIGYMGANFNRYYGTGRAYDEKCDGELPSRRASSSRGPRRDRDGR